MEPAEFPSVKPVDAERPPILSYHGPDIVPDARCRSYLIAAACGVIALVLFSFGIYIVLDLTLGALATSGWVMISILTAPSCFLGGALLVGRIARRQMRTGRRGQLLLPDKESECA